MGNDKEDSAYSSLLKSSYSCGTNCGPFVWYCSSPSCKHHSQLLLSCSGWASIREHPRLLVTFPCTGPAKPMCTFIHGHSGHCHGCKGATEWFSCTYWRYWHCFTSSSMPLSILIQQTNILAKAFIQDAAWCPPCNSSRIGDFTCILLTLCFLTRCSHPWQTTLVTTASRVLRHSQYWLVWGQPVLGSLTGTLWSISVSKNISAGTGTLAGFSGSGRWLEGICTGMVMCDLELQHNNIEIVH